MLIRTASHITVDSILAVAAIKISVALLPRFTGVDGDLFAVNPATATIFATVAIFSAFLMQVYCLNERPRKREIAIRVALGGMISCLPFLALYILVPQLMPAKFVLLIAILIFIVAQCLTHILHWKLLASPRILIIGTGLLARQVAETTANGRINGVVAGFVTCSADLDEELEAERTKPDAEMLPAPIVGISSNLPALASSLRIDIIIIALSERRGVFPVRELLQCKMKGIEILDAPSFCERACSKLMLEHITPSWFILSDGFRRTTFFIIFKRFSDIILSSVGLLLTAPLYPLIALIIKLDSRGPLFLSQTRVGENEELFDIYKFRTMKSDAEKATGAVWSEKNDPRITRVGVFMRTMRIDELPQFYNVLKGDMSFIGPRPERPEFVETLKQIIPYYSKRHFVKPGITGWAQVSYPYGSTVDDAIEKLRYDLYYIKNLSPFLDLLIFFETIKVVLFGLGGR